MKGERAAWERFLPGVAALRRYERPWLRGDIVAGVTVAAYLVPQVMAYAVIAGLPAVVGLWATLAPMLIYFFLGTSRKLSIGPRVHHSADDRGWCRGLGRGSRRARALR